MIEPDDVSAAAWEAAGVVWESLASTAMTRDQETSTLARAIDAAKAEAYGEAAGYVEGKGGVIPGAAVFASLVSRNNQPCMSGDPRDRLPTHTRRDFDDATAALANDIRALVTS